MLSNRTTQSLNIPKDSKKSAKIKPDYVELAKRGIVRTGKKVNIVEPEYCEWTPCGCNVCKNNLPPSGQIWYGLSGSDCRKVVLRRQALN